MPIPFSVPPPPHTHTCTSSSLHSPEKDVCLCVWLCGFLARHCRILGITNHSVISTTGTGLVLGMFCEILDCGGSERLLTFCRPLSESDLWQIFSNGILMSRDMVFITLLRSAFIVNKPLPIGNVESSRSAEPPGQSQSCFCLCSISTPRCSYIFDPQTHTYTAEQQSLLGHCIDLIGFIFSVYSLNLR